MTTATSTELSCREAKLVLQVAPFNEAIKELGENELAAALHYAECDACRRTGLGGILSQSIDCQEALEICARTTRQWLLFATEAKTLKEQLVFEHIMGKHIKITKDEIIEGATEQDQARIKEAWLTAVDRETMELYDYGACEERPCKNLRHHSRGSWVTVEAYINSNGVSVRAHPLVFLVRVFREEGWPLDKLFEIQIERVAEIMQDKSEESFVLENLKVLQESV